jgi:hypothetical protein
MSSPPIHRARLLRAHDRYLLFFLHLLWFPEHHVVCFVDCSQQIRTQCSSRPIFKKKLSKIHAIFIYMVSCLWCVVVLYMVPAKLA